MYQNFKITEENFNDVLLKEMIIREFINWMFLHGDADLQYLRDIKENNPIMTSSIIDGGQYTKKFALTNVVLFDKNKLRVYRYNISGLLSIHNNGRILITSYEIQK